MLVFCTKTSWIGCVGSFFWPAGSTIDCQQLNVNTHEFRMLMFSSAQVDVHD